MSLRRFLSSLAIFAFAMTAMFAAMQPSFAEEDDDNQPNFMSKILGSVGLLQLPGPGIDYQERAPLVVPPISPYVQPVTPVPQQNVTQQNPWDFNAAPTPNLQGTQQDQRAPNLALTLPPPQEQNSVRLRNPDFPIDPEVKAALKRKKNTKKIFSRAEDDPTYSGRTLTPAELQAVKGNNTKSSATNATTSMAPGSVQEMDVPVFSNLLGRIKGGQPEPQAVFTGEPERQSLTQPPSGYLTPSKNAPYGVVGKDKNLRDDQRLVHPNMPDYSGPVPTPR
jgi:hypothetical protein